MRVYDSKQLHGELVTLLDKQLDTLQKECFTTATEVEVQEYVSRRERIDELCDQLMEHKSAA